MILQSMISVGVGVADNIMVGSLGELAISGVAMANQVQNIMQMLVTGVSAAIVLLASQYWGRGDAVMAKKVVSIGLRICLSIGLAVSVFVFAAPQLALRAFTNNWDVIAEGVKYLRIMAISYVFFCLANILIASMRCVETVRISLVIALSTLLIDVGLNYILIFGHFGFPSLGLQGAALATLISRIVEACIIVLYVRLKDEKLRIRIRDLTAKLDGDLLSDFLRYGMPVMIGDLLWGIGGVAQASVIGRLGSSAIAACSITLTLFSFVTVFVYSLGGASGVVIGKTVGANEFEKAKEYTRTLQLIFICTGIFGSTCLFFLRDFFISLYQIPAETTQLARSFIGVLCVTILGTSYHAPCFTGIIRAGGDTRFVLKIDLFFVWAVVMPLSCLAAFILRLPPAAVFFCLKCDQLMKPPIAFWKTNSFSWMKNLTR
jgi:putative MATE family efflux protein